MSYSPPTLTPVARLLIACMDRVSGWSRLHAVIVATGLLAAVTAIDHAVGAGFNVSFLYLLVCVFAVWCLGERGGFAFGVLGAAILSLLRHHQIGHGLPAPGTATELWNFVARTISFCLVAGIVSGLRGALALERWRGSHDDLTGALNKAGFQRAMEQGIAHRRHRRGNLLLAYMDLDGFKAINDRFGHAAGDHVLRALAEASKSAIRRSDLFGRVGGDEFALLLFLPAHVDGSRVAELIHARLTGLLDRTGYAVTCSLGAVFMSAEEAAQDGTILEQADTMMYEVKRAGKNAVRVVHGRTLVQATPATSPAVRRDEPDELDELLRRIDAAERRCGWTMRRAA